MLPVVVISVMALQTTTVVLEGPTGREETINDVLSVTTKEDGTILIDKEGEDDLVEFGWDYTIREVDLSAPEIAEDEYVLFLNGDHQLQEGKITSIRGDEIQVKTLPDRWMTYINRTDIIKSLSEDTY